MEKIPQTYRNYFISQKSQLDKTYGVRLDQKTGQWKIGSKTIDFKPSNNKIIINDNENIATTDGLYELLFLKKPQNYDENDLETYKLLLESTNAHRRNNNASLQMLGTNSYKYNKIIRPLFAQKASKQTDLQNTSGGGLKQVNDNKIDYIYYHNANMLVDRLRLLYASQQAGNNSHVNEIASIIEELRELEVID